MAAGIAYGHLDIGGEDGDQQHDDQPGGEPAGGCGQQQEGEGYFADAANVDQGKVVGQVGRHNTFIHAGMPEMIDAGGHIKNDHAVEGEKSHWSKLQRIQKSGWVFAYAGAESVEATDGSVLNQLVPICTGIGSWECSLLLNFIDLMTRHFAGAGPKLTKYE